MTTIYLVRHGQSQANEAGIMQGSQIDTPLTELGKEQALFAKEKLQGIFFDQSYASPLKRAKQTAKIITRKDPRLDKRLLEFDYGSWDGQKLSDIYQKYAQYFDENYNLLPNSWEASGGQTYVEVTTKVKSFLTDVQKKHKNETILVVSHGFTIKLLVAYLLDIGKLESLNEPANASVTKIVLKNDTQTLFYYGK